MFKIKKTEFSNKTFRLPQELIIQLETIAQAQQVSVNNLVIQCCEYALNNIDDTSLKHLNKEKI